MSEDGYYLESEILHAVPEDEQHMIEAAFKVHEENKVHRLIDNTVESNVLGLFKNVHNKDLASSHTELYQTVEQATTNVTYFAGANEIINTKIEKLTESLDFM